MSDQAVLDDINRIIVKLKSNHDSIVNMDEVYRDWCEIVEKDMLTYIPHIIVKNDMLCNFRKHRPGKLWWNETLSDLWSKLCVAEKKWLNCCPCNLKTVFKADYVKIR